jgi:arylsulfatase
MPKIYLLTFLLALNFSCSQGNLLRKYHSNAPEKIDKRPNIVIIMADDLGYSDLGCYGGEIQTPNLDQLAQNGIRFTQFYNGARCCPTRASLLTGKYPHQVGLAFNGHNLSTDTPTLAELLKDQGYSTGMTGKWHLSQTQALHNREEQLQWLAHHKDSSRFADPATYPFNRGFEEHWGVIWGVVNFFDPFSLVHNEEAISDVSEDFYMTDFISDKSVELIDQFHKKDKPFFLYIAHTAPHWPLHALPEDIKKYEGVYDKGWEELRKTRVHGLISQAIIDPKTAPPTLNESGLEWEDCEQKSWESAHMEAHAAMVDRMDQGIGRVIAKLKETDELENTLILFLADNGASPERYLGKKSYTQIMKSRGLKKPGAILELHGPVPSMPLSAIGKKNLLKGEIALR